MTAYSKEIADRILALMVDGDAPLSMRGACKEVGVAPGTFAGWVTDDRDGLEARYRTAQMIRAQLVADEILEIADDNASDYYTDDEGLRRVDHDHIQRSKLRVDTRKWLLAKALPKIYGDKLQHVGDGGGPVKTQIDLAGMTDEELDALERSREILRGALAGKRPVGD